MSTVPQIIRKKGRGAVFAGMLALAILAVPLLSPAVGQAKKPAPLYWGAQVGPQFTGTAAPWDMKAISKFEKVTGKGLSLIEFFSPFAQCSKGHCVHERFPATPFEDIRKYGAIPFLSWNSTSSPPSLDQPAFRLRSIINGTYDSYIRTWASSAAAWGHPFFLRFNWEMNGFWFPWSEGVNGNQAGQYNKAWRHVHDIFNEVGATNATWVWCPNVNIYGELPNLRPMYPGDRYVDWTCLDGFNWGVRHGSPGWLSFDEIYKGTYDTIVKKIAPSKPMMIAEIASSTRGGNKAAWIKNMLNTVRTRYRKIRGLIWIDVNERQTNWPIEATPQSKRAFRAGIRNSAYVPNVFGELTGSPIKPPAAG